jgi:(heptosyl)LPS beta-1,4-glucosyltransferase
VKVSAVIITRNEEKILAQCLDSLGWAGEIIVVDSGSSDRTLEIAEEYGAKIYKRKWPGYAGQKNYGISKAKGEWILSIDADEIITGELRGEIEGIVGNSERGTRKSESKTQIDNRQPTTVNRNSDVTGYYIPRRTFFYGSELRFGDVYPDSQLRLFKKGRGSYVKTELHERIKITGKTGVLKNPMLHYSKADVQAHVRAMNDYTGLELRRAVRIGYRPTGYSVFLKPAFNFIKYYFFKLGFLDGTAGFIYQAVTEQYYFVKEVKIMQALGMGWGDMKGTLFKRAK